MEENIYREAQYSVWPMHHTLDSLLLPLLFSPTLHFLHLNDVRLTTVHIANGNEHTESYRFWLHELEILLNGCSSELSEHGNPAV